MSGRPASARKIELIKLLGLEDSKRNWSVPELEKKLKRHQEKDKAKESQKELATQVAGSEPLEEQVMIPDSQLLSYRQDDPFGGLTDQQRTIARLRIRGLNQKAIAQVVGISQPMVSKELTAIREFQEKKGAGLEQAAIIGETSSLYEEIEYQAWSIYHSVNQDAPEAKLKALETVMKARNAHTKILMDVGLVKKAGVKIEHTMEISPFLKKIEEARDLKKLGDGLVSGHLSDLAAPQKDDIIDAEVVEDDPEDNEIELAPPVVKEEPVVELELEELPEPEPPPPPPKPEPVIAKPHWLEYYAVGESVEVQDVQGVWWPGKVFSKNEISLLIKLNATGRAFRVQQEKNIRRPG